METSIAGVLVAGVLLAAVVVSARFATFASTVTGTAIKDAATLSGDRLRTYISIRAATSTASDLTIELDNEGSTALADLNEMDVIVAYLDSGGTKNIERLTYSSSTPATADKWVVDSITPNTFQPTTWNPGEKLFLKAVLSPAQQVGNTGTVAVSTPNGVSVTGTYTR